MKEEERAGDTATAAAVGGGAAFNGKPDSAVSSTADMSMPLSSIVLDDLVPLRPKQCEKLAFPPTCPVVYTDLSQQKITYAVVETAFLLFGSRETVYQLGATSSTPGGGNGKQLHNDATKPLLVPESALQFGRGATVWVTPPNGADRVAGVVLNALNNNNLQPLYSVKTVDGWFLHFCAAVEYRDPAISTCAVETKEVPAPEHESLANAHDDDEGSPKPVVVSHHHHGGNDATNQQQPLAASELEVNTEDTAAVPTSIIRRATYPCRRISDLTATTAESSLESSTWQEEQAGAGPTTSHHHHHGAAAAAADGWTTTDNTMLHHSPKRSSPYEYDQPEEEEESATKRQKQSVPFVILPIWLDAQTVQHCFYSSQVRLESETNCELTLRGGAVEPDAPEAYKLYIEIDGPDNAIAYARRRLEDLFLSSKKLLKDRGEVSLFMYHMARANLDHYHHQGNFVYQRDALLPKRRNRWMTFIDTPADLKNVRGRSLLVGGKGRGIEEIQGNTDCTISITETPNAGIFLAGDLLDEIEDCIPRVWARVAYAQQQLALPPPFQR